MKFGVLGTGIVGRTLATKLAECNHEVMLGTRDVTTTLARTQLDVWSNLPFHEWKEQHSEIQLGTFAQTAAHGEILLNATAGNVSLEVLQTMSIDDLNGKTLIDTANPLDFSHGFPPSLSFHG
ncbi:NAD(P)-binding domain-containing protein [Ktedonobacter racemifer]|uniref:NAD(P)-binding domain-containing protein n=1 Tax=Ktedonobacter racemifer TaxID=363277 RepID=UPI000695B98C|nr:NAD(P)-binding domain-containing protein [Ktedonobacter racemifer]